MFMKDLFCPFLIGSCYLIIWTHYTYEIINLETILLVNSFRELF